MAARPTDNRPLSSKCRFDPTVQSHPLDMKCRVVRSGIRSVEPHPEIKALFTFTALNLCRLVPAQISINRESTLAGKSTSAQGASKK